MQISIFAYSWIFIKTFFGEKSFKNWEIKKISAYVQHRLTKLVPNESLDIAL